MKKIPVLFFFMLIAWAAASGQTGETKAQDTTRTTERQYVKVEVDGLACPFCAYGLEKKLKDLDGQKDLHIDIQGGYATFNLPGDTEVTKKDIEEIVKDAGFEARKVVFRKEAFNEEG